MASKTKRILRIHLLFFIFSISSIEAADLLWKWCSTNNNYTANSVFANNLNTLLTSIASNTSIVNFATFTQGSGHDTAYALAQCRGDSIPSTCRSCLADAATQITKSCPNQKSATLLYDDNSSNNTAPACLLRYDNSSFFGSVDPTYSGMAMPNPNDIPDNTTFNPLLQQLLANLTATATATANTIVKYFAVGNTPWKTFQKLYGMVQCTQDLSAANCALCINNEIEEIPLSTVYNKQGGRLYTRSCWIRFDMNQFYTAPTTSSSPPPPGNETTAPTPAGSTNAVANSKSTTIIIVAAVVAVALLVVILLVFFVCRKKRRNAKSTEEDTEDLEAIEALYFSLSTIRAATNNFSDKNKLGEGGYGPVYKGRLKDGQEIAVKRMSSHSGQGMTEFKNEVQLIAKLQHRNLVRLFGCCVEDKEKILVYEFLPNTSLDHFLFDPTRNAELDWSTRFKIIVGTARGILYLHEDSRLKIIHRDLKVSNVLLDSEMNPKIADFGLAKLVNLDETQYNTNRIAGTFGYMSPEYVMQGKFSVKSDVFSFGVLVLEIISGQKNSSFSGTDGAVDMLVHTWRLWRDGRALDLLDETLREFSPRSDVLRCIHIALLCVQEVAEDRPHMSSIVFMLNSTSMTLPSPLPPAFFSATHRLATEDYSTTVSLLRNLITMEHYQTPNRGRRI